LEEADVTGMEGVESDDDVKGFQIKKRKSGFSMHHNEAGEDHELFGDLILLQALDCIDLFSRVYTLKSMQPGQKSERSDTNQRLSSWNLFTLKDTSQRELKTCFDRLNHLQQTKSWRKKMSPYRLGLPHYPLTILQARVDFYQALEWAQIDKYGTKAAKHFTHCL